MIIHTNTLFPCTFYIWRQQNSKEYFLLPLYHKLNPSIIENAIFITMLLLLHYIIIYWHEQVGTNSTRYGFTSENIIKNARVLMDYIGLNPKKRTVKKRPPVVESNL